MTLDVILGNGISALGSVFMIASCVTKQRERVFYYQFIQCMLLSVSSWFLCSYSGMAANLISGVRNIAVAKQRFDQRTMIGFLFTSVLLGLIVNNRGWIGLLPILANLQYAVCSYAFTSLKGTKLSIWVNVLIWILYSFLVLDFATGISDSIVLFVNSWTLIRLSIHEKKEHVAHLLSIQKQGQ